MLWYKSWLETRWQFLIGLAVLMLAVAGAVFGYPQVMKLMPMASTIDASGEIGRRIKEGVELAREYRGYIWSQLFRQNLTEMGTLFAVVLGSGGPFSRGSELFTLSLPASRNRLLAIRAATGLAELLALAFVPVLLVPLLSPAVGQAYSMTSTLIHGTCFFIATAVFFSLAVLLSTSFSDMWRPLLIACSVAVVLWFFEQIVRDLSRYSIFTVMNAEEYFRTGHLPWLGLLASAVASVGMLYGAAINIARRDF